MKRASKRENNQGQLPHAPPGQESEPGTQSLHRGVWELLAKLTHAVKEDGTMKPQRQAVRGINRDRHSIGLDLGDKRSKSCFLDVDAAIVAEGSFATTREDFVAYVSAIP